MRIQKNASSFQEVLLFTEKNIELPWENWRSAIRPYR